MVEPRSDELQVMLRQAGTALCSRPSPDLAPAVRARLEAAPTPVAQAPQRVGRWRGALVATAAVVTVVLVPGVRGAIADLIDSIPGITLRMDQGSTAPMTTPPVSNSGDPLGAPLGLVGVTDLATTMELVPYELPLPGELGDPDAVYVREGVVTMLWRSSPDLPALGDTEVGLIIDVIDGSDGPVFEKLLRGVEVEWFDIDGAPAAWVAEAHPLVVVNAEGIPDGELERIAVRTLLVSGVTTVRVESLLTRDEAVALVRSFG